MLGCQKQMQDRQEWNSNQGKLLGCASSWLLRQCEWNRRIPSDWCFQSHAQRHESGAEAATMTGGLGDVCLPLGKFYDKAIEKGNLK